MKKLGEINGLNFYALDKTELVMDEFMWGLIKHNLECVFHMIPKQEQAANNETNLGLFDGITRSEFVDRFKHIFGENGCNRLVDWIIKIRQDSPA